jgi:hypothetical protein
MISCISRKRPPVAALVVEMLLQRRDIAGPVIIAAPKAGGVNSESNVTHRPASHVLVGAASYPSP